MQEEMFAIEKNKYEERMMNESHEYRQKESEL